MSAVKSPFTGKEVTLVPPSVTQAMHDLPEVAWMDYDAMFGGIVALLAADAILHMMSGNAGLLVSGTIDWRGDYSSPQAMKESGAECIIALHIVGSPGSISMFDKVTDFMSDSVMEARNEKGDDGFNFEDVSIRFTEKMVAEANSLADQVLADTGEELPKLDVDDYRNRRHDGE